MNKNDEELAKLKYEMSEIKNNTVSLKEDYI